MFKRRFYSFYHHGSRSKCCHHANGFWNPILQSQISPATISITAPYIPFKLWFPIYSYNEYGVGWTDVFRGFLINFDLLWIAAQRPLEVERLPAEKGRLRKIMSVKNNISKFVPMSKKKTAECKPMDGACQLRNHPWPQHQPRMTRPRVLVKLGQAFLYPFLFIVDLWWRKSREWRYFTTICSVANFLQRGKTHIENNSWNQLEV